jgi:hypothetical protein
MRGCFEQQKEDFIFTAVLRGSTDKENNPKERTGFKIHFLNVPEVPLKVWFFFSA